MRLYRLWYVLFCSSILYLKGMHVLGANDGDVFHFSKITNYDKILHTNYSTTASTYVISSEMSPFVVRSGVDHYRLMIGVNNPDIESIEIAHPRLKRFNSSLLILYDDGSNGDDEADDLIFTVDLLDPPTVAEYDFWWDRFVECTFHFSNGSQQTISEGLGLVYGAINPVVVSIPTVHVLDSNIQATDYVVNIAADNSYATGFPDFALVDDKYLERVYYNYFPDSLDLMIQPVPISQTFFRRGFYSGNSNATGIGSKSDGPLPLGGRMFGKVFTTGLDVEADLLLHEILHAWVSYLSSMELSTSDGHWEVIERSTSGFGPGGITSFSVFDTLEKRNDGRYWCRERQLNTQNYNDIELYLMGLQPIDSIDEIRTLVNPVYDERIADNGHFYWIYNADSIRTISTPEIIQTIGSRQPEYPNASTKFNVAPVIPSLGRLMTGPEMAYFHYVFSNFFDFNTFENASGNKGTLCLKNIPRLTPLSFGTPFQWSWNHTNERIIIRECYPNIQVFWNQALGPGGQDIGWTHSWSLRPADLSVGYTTFQAGASSNLAISHDAIDAVLADWGVAIGDSILVEHGIGGCRNSIGLCWAPVYRSKTMFVRGGSANCCLQDIVESCPGGSCEILSGNYKASRAITYSGDYFVKDASTVIFDAGQSCLLNEGFEVKVGGVLEIMIGGCVERLIIEE